MITEILLLSNGVLSYRDDKGVAVSKNLLTPEIEKLIAENKVDENTVLWTSSRSIKLSEWYNITGGTDENKNQNP